MTASTRDALAKLGINTDDRRDPKPKRKRKGKPRQPKPQKRALPVETTCCLCRQKVKTKDTREIPIGRACKKHPGV